MLMTVTYFTLLSQFPNTIRSLRACVPNTQFYVDGKMCQCNNIGQWSESNCRIVERRQLCIPGQVTSEGCNQCVCQANGQFLCTNQVCKNTLPPQSLSSPNLGYATAWCTPFRSYYVNCNICVCSATGRMSDAHCAKDPTCSLIGQPSISDLTKVICIPKVMYLFPCLNCLCSDNGYFIADKCIETCQEQQKLESIRRCIPKTFYRKDCNICRCPANSIPDDKLCSNSICKESMGLSHLGALRSKSQKCCPHTFTKAICLYCDCSNKGVMNESSCIELGCASDYGYDTPRVSCSPGETVPICTECLCLRDGYTNSKYCSKTCSYESKLDILENVIKDSLKDDTLIDKQLIKKSLTNEACEPGSIYADHQRYCLCPDNGLTNFHLCRALKETTVNKKVVNAIAIDFNITCEPNTFIEFDCNTCFCTKMGKIDPKWCTYDDCEAKRIIQEAHTKNPKIKESVVAIETCSPGSITKVECNYCICPDTGYVKHLVCTKNDCSSFNTPFSDDKFTCEPLAYYEVDCNVCFCPRDGLKNVAKCTKNHCERNFLRSDACVAGQLFSDECNVCVCPPNGNKSEKACTNYTCSDTAPWKKIFQLSESLLGNQVVEDVTRNLEMCFQGEEFAIGCKLCVCPDTGLRVYATCSHMLCDEKNSEKSDQDFLKRIKNRLPRNVRRTADEDCINNSSLISIQHCTPGSMYIIRCRQCICPYMGSIAPFCRPLPENQYCEQPYPNFHYLPMGMARRNTEETIRSPNSTTANVTASLTSLKIRHPHTKYHCDKPGKVMDVCFLCECEDNNVLIEEHCFKSGAENCSEVLEPSFLMNLNKVDLD